MSKSLQRLIVLALLLTPGTAAAGVWSHLSFSVAPTAILSLTGNYNDTAAMKNMVIPGAGLGLVLRYKFTQNLFLDAGYSYNWMFYRKDTRPEDYTSEKPAWIIPSYTLNGTLFLTSKHPVRPYVTAGGGFCPWWFSSRVTGGTLFWFPGTDDVKFSKISWTVNGGMGIEVAISSKAALFAEAKYHYIFARDASRFGTGSFTDQSVLGIRLGMTVYLGKDSH